MSGHGLPSTFDRAAARWRDLALRRHDYYLELLRSGRWRRYFSERDFMARLREVIEVTSALTRCAPDGSPAVVERPHTRSAA